MSAARKPTGRRRKNLLVDHPAWAERLGEEWDYERNEEIGIRPGEVAAGSHKKAWWRGSECGHEWLATIRNRVTCGCGCPYCAHQKFEAGINDLATEYPDLAVEWDAETNGQAAEETLAGGRKKWSWICRKCGHKWMSAIKTRRRGVGCPACAHRVLVPDLNDLATELPELVSEWDEEANGMPASAAIAGGPQSRAWRCSTCGHTWRATINARRSGQGCPKCAFSHGEKEAARWAESVGFVPHEQWYSPECRDQMPLRFDLMLYAPMGDALMEMAVCEYDGEQHFDKAHYFNRRNLARGKGFDYIRRHDAIKDAYCEATGRILVRVPYTITGVEDIGNYIEAELRKHGLGWWFDQFSDSCGEVA